MLLYFTHIFGGACVLGDVLLCGVLDDEGVDRALARDLVLVGLLHRARALEPRDRHVGLAQVDLELDVLADLADGGLGQPLDEVDLGLLDDEHGRALGGVGDGAGVLPGVGRLGRGDLQDLLLAVDLEADPAALVRGEVDLGAVLVPLGHGVALGELDLEGGRLARRHLGVGHLLDELGGQLDHGHLAGTLL